MELRSWLARSPVVAILRGVKPEEVEAIVEALEENAILVVEVPLNRRSLSTASNALRAALASACWSAPER